MEKLGEFMREGLREEISSFIEAACESAGTEFRYDYPENQLMEISSPTELGIRFHELDDTDRSDLPPKQTTADKFQLTDCIHIWRDQWERSREKVQSKLRSSLGVTERIHGRETKVEKIDNATLLTFLSQNHLHVPIRAKHKYALFKKAELVAVMSFSKPREIDRNGIKYQSYELMRYCSKLNQTVVGGFSKLLQHFIIEHSPDDIMTYVDADWSSGHHLSAFGFEYESYKNPIEFWINRETLERQYPHVVLKSLGFDEEISAAEKSVFLKQHKLISILNSGSYKYVKRLK